MLAYVVGNVDFNSAAVLCVAFVAMCIVSTAAIAKWRSAIELNMQFEIDKNKLSNDATAVKHGQDHDHEYKLAKLSTERDVQFKRIESGMIELKKNPNYEE